MPEHADPVPRGRVRRTMPLAGFTARAAGGRLVAELKERTGHGGAVARFHERTADRYVDLLGHSRGVMMKAGQMLSMIDPGTVGNGGFSPYQQALLRLHADAPPMPVALMREILDAELGSAVDQFTAFDDEPMAAASIGQVHRAVLRDGRDVAVKLQYPGVAQAIRDDLANTELLTTLLRFAASAAGVTSDLRSVARESAARIAEETDYRHEAATVAAFSELYRGHPFIRVPDVVPELSTERVLTMTYLHGIGWAAAQHASQELKDTWAEVIMRFFHGNFRHANFLHADPHPGNYRFGADGSVGFVDFGCVKVLPEELRLPWVRMNRAVIDGHFDVGRELMTQLGFIAEDEAITTDELRAWWDVLFTEIRMPQPVTYAPDATTRLLGELFSTDAAKPVNRIRVPEDFAMFPRVQLALSHVAGALHATLPARAIHEDVDGVAEPATELGRLHHTWARARGLPTALEAHPSPATERDR